jgi:hypothetical protein
MRVQAFLGQRRSMDQRSLQIVRNLDAKTLLRELSVGDIGLGGRGMKIVLALLQQSRVQALNAIYRKRVLSGTELLFRPKY